MPSSSIYIYIVYSLQFQYGSTFTACGIVLQYPRLDFSALLVVGHMSTCGSADCPPLLCLVKCPGHSRNAPRRISCDVSPLLAVPLLTWERGWSRSSSPTRQHVTEPGQCFLFTKKNASVIRSSTRTHACVQQQSIILLMTQDCVMHSRRLLDFHYHLLQCV